MADSEPPVAPIAEDYRSTGALFRAASEAYTDFTIMRHKSDLTGEWISHTWKDLRKMVDETAAALAKEGVERGDRVAILANSRMEWCVVDLANFTLGAVTVPVYQSNLPDEVEYILDHSGAKIVFVEDGEQLSKVQQIRGACPAVTRAIQFSGKVRSDDEFVRALDRFRDTGREYMDAHPELLEERLAAVGREDMATIVYTSGTTGRPKGAVLTHDALLFEIGSLGSVMRVDTTDETLLFLPMAHIFARVGFLVTLQCGFIISFAENIATVMTNMAEIQPTFVFSVPRIYEKVYTTVTTKIAKGLRLSKQMFAFALFIGRWTSRVKREGRWAWWKYPHLVFLGEMANMLVFNRLAKLFGGKLRFFISGGAPLPREIAEFMHSIGVLVLEGWGLTETTAAATLNTLDAYRFGAVGKMLPGCQVVVADDGELLIGGRNLLKEYYRRPEATAEALRDGWFYTGDIGEIDADGFVRITDRKKDLIVTSGGKNIAPQNIENWVKQEAWISQVMVYGDKRNYLVALVTLDELEVTQYADEKELEYESFPELTRHPRIRYKIDKAMEEKNKKLPSWETIKYWAVLERDFEVGEELTPTLKVKRKVCTEKYWDVLDGMYQGKSKGGR